MSPGLRSSGLLGGGDWDGDMVTPGSMALSVESCVWSRVCEGLPDGGDGETSSVRLVGEDEEAMLVGDTVVVVVGTVVVGNVLALLVMEAGGL